jgi:hypothetical protein
MSLAKTPLPVPVSPNSSTGESTVAHCNALSRTVCMATLPVTTGTPSVAFAAVRLARAHRALRTADELLHAGFVAECQHHPRGAGSGHGPLENEIVETAEVLRKTRGVIDPAVDPAPTSASPEKPRKVSRNPSEKPGRAVAAPLSRMDGNHAPSVQDLRRAEKFAS